MDKKGRDTGGTPVPPRQPPPAPLKIRQGAYLPHWTCEGSIYAVTFRLADSLPQHVLEQWLFEREDIVRTARHMVRRLTADEEQRLHRLHSQKVESFLDAGHGACWFKAPRVAELVSSALKYFNRERYDLFAWCIMPNHVHTVLRPLTGYELPGILHSWKSYTGKAANKILGRNGEFWQAEYYDHLIRDKDDFHRCLEYVRQNPEKAELTNWKWMEILRDQTG